MAWSAVYSAQQVLRFVNNRVLTCDEVETNILGNVESYAAKGFGRYAVHLKSNNK